LLEHRFIIKLRRDEALAKGMDRKKETKKPKKKKA
jgi:hypothetical protein